MSIKARLLAVGLIGSLAVGGTFIATQEGEVRNTYYDLAGIETACFGQTGPHIKAGMEFSANQCIDMFADSLHKFNNQLLDLAPPLTDGEHIAYLSFIYNVGAEAFGASTLRKKLLANDRVGACNELSRWVYVKGKRVQGLINRRSDERRYCLRDLQHVS
ncbi:lysozyme [Shewanella sp. T24-MNA-CIBAN-0130]|uniref:lysozyme n=1 Tax=Shewanella sp. T24-MNA-CIBAN-0130 TaxID=3140470 RepID=UPI0033315CE1